MRRPVSTVTPCLCHLGDDCLPGILKVSRYGIPWERPEKALALPQDAVAYEVHCLYQEVTGAHGGIKHLKIE